MSSADQSLAWHGPMRALLGDALLLDSAERLAYSYDNSRRSAMPDAVALVRDAAQVQALVRIARQHRLPVVARGRGTNTTGAAVPVAGGIVISFERMHQIVAIRPGDRVAVVEPGVLNGDLQTALGEHGLFWPPDPTSAPYSSIGGNIACNAGGPHAVKYGASRDNVLGVTLIDGRGELLRFGAAVSKSASGFDMTRFLIGSEGTLGLIVEATLKLTPQPSARQSLRALYRDVDSAAAAVARLMAQPVTPSMLEFMDSQCVQLVRDLTGNDLPAAGALLMIEADGDASTLPAAMIALQNAASGEGMIAIDIATDKTQEQALWAARKALSPALRKIASGKINEDVVVPVSRIPDLVRAVQQLSITVNLPIVCFGHAGNGNLHVNILYEPADTDQTARAQQAMHALFDQVIALGGTLSGEHGIGMAKREFMVKAYDAPTLSIMQQIKQVFDPDGILNPGKLLP